VRRIDPWAAFPDVQHQLAGDGAFLVSVGSEGHPNVMTIGWGLLGTIWRRQVFLVLVRPSRYTHGLIEKSDAFAVCVPKAGELSDALAFCGSRSGREVDKVKELGLDLVPGQAGPVPLLAECDVHYECRVVTRTALVPEGLLSPEIRARYYARGDLHTLFFGEILAAWRD